MAKEDRTDNEKIAEPRHVQWLEHRHGFRARRCSEARLIQKARKPDGEHVEHNSDDDLAGSRRHVEEGKEQPDNKAGKDCGDESGPDDPGHVAGEVARKRP